MILNTTKKELFTYFSNESKKFAALLTRKQIAEFVSTKVIDEDESWRYSQSIIDLGYFSVIFNHKKEYYFLSNTRYNHKNQTVLILPILYYTDLPAPLDEDRRDFEIVDDIQRFRTGQTVTIYDSPEFSEKTYILNSPK